MPRWPDTAEVAGVERDAAADAVDALIEAQLLHHGSRRASSTRSSSRRSRTRSRPPSARSSTWPPLVRSRGTRLGASGPPPTCWPSAPAGEPWAFEALTAAARRAGDRGAADHAVRFLRRALEEEAPDRGARSTLLELGAAESAARLPEATGRMEEAQRLSSSPAERAQAALGLSMVRFLAAELPGAVAACEDVLATAGDLDRELRLGLEFQAAATRLVGGLPSVETFGRLLALEQEVSRGETAAERSLLALIALVFAATTAQTADEVAALAEAAWGDGQLLVEIRSQHSALAAPATTIALTAAPTAIALTGRLSRAIEIWTAGVEEGRARSSMLLYANSLGTRASAREWTGDLGGAEADAVAALALLPADDPIIRPSAISALVDVHIERGALAQAAAVLRDAWPTGELPLSLSISQALASRGRLALRTGDPRAALNDLEEAGRRAQALAYVNPCALMWRSYAALAAARLGDPDPRPRARRGGARDRAPLRRAGADRRSPPRARAARPERGHGRARPRGDGCPRRLRAPGGACTGADRSRRRAPTRGSSTGGSCAAARGTRPREPVRIRDRDRSGDGRAAGHRRAPTAPRRARRRLALGPGAPRGDDGETTGSATARSPKPCSSLVGRSRCI